MVIAVWVLGALLSLIGALCYAELASAFPNAGGEYHFLGRAFGSRFAILYGWSRLLIIQTGSVALLAYVYGDYATRLLPLGPYSGTLHAAIAVIAVTMIHWAGVRSGARTQFYLTLLEIAGLAVLLVAALGAEPVVTASPPAERSSSIGLALVFVLLTYGGWNEAAYLSAELDRPYRRMPQVLLISLGLITAAYLLVNFAFLKVLGLEGLAQSDAPAADLLGLAWGSSASIAFSFMIAAAALASTHGTIFTGARSAYAMGRDVKALGFIGRWHQSRSTPANALLLQGALALLLVLMGAFARDGFQLAVEYTAPAFWFFTLAVGIALFVLRHRAPSAVRAFRVPLYPVLPGAFCLSSAYLLYSSLAYTGAGAWVSVVVVVSGCVLFPFRNTNAEKGNL